MVFEHQPATMEPLYTSGLIPSLLCERPGVQNGVSIGPQVAPPGFPGTPRLGHTSGAHSKLGLIPRTHTILLPEAR